MPSGSGPRTPLFAGLEPQALAGLAAMMTPREFAAGEALCVEGEPGNSLFVLQSGLAEVAVTGGRVVARLRRGDVVGEMSLLTGDPRSATVTAIVPTSALELGREAFTRALAMYPVILTNLTAILSARLAKTNTRRRADRRGEAVGLLVAGAPPDLARDVADATAATATRPVARVVIGRTDNAEPGDANLFRFDTVVAALDGLDDLLDRYGAVICDVTPAHAELGALFDQMDRIVAIANHHELARLGARFPAHAERFEIALAGEPSFGSATRSPRIVRVIRDARDVAWLGRHLARTKLGLALGAGGAKGYAHIAVLYALERAGYTVDYVAGSSIGALIGAWRALGRDAGAVEATMRAVFTPDNVASMFKLATSGMSSGLDVLARACQESTEKKTFEDLLLPLVMMSVDLNTRQPVAITGGVLWEGCLAAMAVAGVYPPYQRDSERLVDAVALVPVPADELFIAGADIVVAVNLMSREVLPAWPGETLAPLEPKSSRVRMLDTLMEVMDLAQLDASIRHAARADVTITPRFGPATWRDFHLADRILAAGAAAAATGVTELNRWARPAP